MAKDFKSFSSNRRPNHAKSGCAVSCSISALRHYSSHSTMPIRRGSLPPWSETSGKIVTFRIIYRINNSIPPNYRSGTEVSVFKERTEESSASQYFQFYGYLSQQQNMMQDFIRTSTYQRAILSNLTDFRDKVVLDVGAGSGILSFFAQQAGAKKVNAALDVCRELS